MPGSGPNPGNLAPRGRRRPKAPVSPPLPLRTCQGCGGGLRVDDDRDRPRIDWCPECLPRRRSEIGISMAARGREAAERTVNETGARPTHTETAKRSRAEANARQREEQRRWLLAGQKEPMEPIWFERNVLSKLATFSLPA